MVDIVKYINNISRLETWIMYVADAKKKEEFSIIGLRYKNSILDMKNKSFLEGKHIKIINLGGKSLLSYDNYPD